MKSCAIEIVTNGTAVNCIVRKFEHTKFEYVLKIIILRDCNHFGM